MDALSVLVVESSQNKLNWSDNSMLRLACEYIDGQKDPEAFSDFVERKAKEEAGALKEAEENTKPAKMSFAVWKKEVDKLFKETTGCDWDDLCGDAAPLEQAYATGDTPGEFVRWQCEKHGLGNLED
jgi:hypothetical protein